MLNFLIWNYYVECHSGEFHSVLYSFCVMSFCFCFSSPCKATQAANLWHHPRLQLLEGPRSVCKRFCWWHLHGHDRKWNLHLFILRSLSSFQVKVEIIYIIWSVSVFVYLLLNEWIDYLLKISLTMYLQKQCQVFSPLCHKLFENWYRPYKCLIVPTFSRKIIQPPIWYKSEWQSP